MEGQGAKLLQSSGEHESRDASDRLTDRQTGRLTDCHSSLRGMLLAWQKQCRIPEDVVAVKAGKKKNKKILRIKQY